MAPTPELRHAREGDVPALSALARMSPYTAQAGFWRHNIREGDVYVAEIAGEIAGFLVFKTGKAYSTIAYLAVRPEARQTGIGSAFVRLAIAADPHGRIRLICESANEYGLKWWAERGWVQIGVGQTALGRAYVRMERR